MSYLNMTEELQPLSPVDPIENIVPTIPDAPDFDVANNPSTPETPYKSDPKPQYKDEIQPRDNSGSSKPTTIITIDELQADTNTPVDVFEPIVDGGNSDVRTNVSTKNVANLNDNDYYKKYMKYKYKYMKANKN